MTMTDPIADFLTRIRNAIMAKHDTVEVPASKAKLQMAKVLKQEGFIQDYASVDEFPPKIRITLRYDTEGANAITGLERISKPGRRIYRGWQEVPRVLNGMGLCMMSTSTGIISGEECRSKKVGGEVMCYVW